MAAPANYSANYPSTYTAADPANCPLYYPVPGQQHIQVLVQQRRPVAPKPKVGRGTVPQRHARPSPLLMIALDAAFGIRDASALTPQRYAAGVRGHVNARRRTTAPAGPVRILTCHAREGGEFFGTVQSAGRRYAYAARVAGGKLVSFKVL